MKPEASPLIGVSLSNDEIAFIEAALLEWGGGASGTEKLAVAIGFKDISELWRERDRILAAVRSRQPLSKADWTRLLLAVEIAFVSDVVGVGVEWSILTGLDDTESLTVLRSLQRILVRVIDRSCLA